MYTLSPLLAILALLTLASPTSNPLPDDTAANTNTTIMQPRAPPRFINAAMPVSHVDADTNYTTCRDFTWVDQSSRASPMDDDCRRLRDNIAGGGYWEVEGATGNQHQLAQFGTCAVGVEKDFSQGGDVYYYVGNKDIMHIIDTSIYFWGTDRVGSKGEMTCAAKLFPPRVKWGLYHT